MIKVKGFDSKHGGDQSTILDKSGTAFCYLQKAGTKGGRAPCQLCLLNIILRITTQSGPKDRCYRNNDIVTLKRANTNVHIGTREMYTQEMEVEEAKG